MKILLAEDREQTRKLFLEIVERLNSKSFEKIVPIIVNSLDELNSKLLSCTFDILLIDNNLSRWAIHNDNSLEKKGLELCERVVKNTTFLNAFSQLVLYSSDGINQSNYSFRTLEKTNLPDNIKEICEHYESNVISTKRSILADEFRQFSISQQRWYYKNYILDKIKPEYRFLDFAPNTSWASDLTNEKNETIIGSPLFRTKSNSLYSVRKQYSELDRFVSIKKDFVPVILWNFSDLDNFTKQTELINSQRIENNFIKEFYSIAYSNSLSNFILKKRSIIGQLQKINNNQDSFIWKEIQCQLINKMYQEDEKYVNKKNILQKLHNVSSVEIVDYFDGTLESYDPDSDIATVKLSSMIDTKKYFYKKLSYKRLKSNGIKFKESRFTYCISEFQNAVNGYLEPK